VKNKLLVVAFITIFICSTLSIPLSMAQCPRCDGTGEIICPYCDGAGEITVEEGAPCEHCYGTGTLDPVIITKSRSSWLNEGKISVQVNYENQEPVSTYGTVTATVEVGDATYTETSLRTLFPANEITQVSLTISGISSEDYNTLQEGKVFSTDITLTADKVPCPYCDGTGLAAAAIECPQCDGTGYIECPECGGTGVEGGEQNAGLDIAGTAYGVAVVVIIAGVAIGGFVLVKKRGVTEEALRKMEGKPASQSDVRMGIDGYTVEGQPVAIKQADGVDRNVIERLAAAMGRHNAKNGTIVAFSFGTDAIRGRVRAKMSYGFDIQMVTVRELINSRNRLL
jgi:hypothetical protein